MAALPVFTLKTTSLVRGDSRSGGGLLCGGFGVWIATFLLSFCSYSHLVSNRYHHGCFFADFSTTWASTIGHKTMYVGFGLAGVFDAVTLLGLLPDGKRGGIPHAIFRGWQAWQFNPPPPLFLLFLCSVASPLATAAAIGLEGIILLSHAVSTQDSDLDLRIHVCTASLSFFFLFLL